MFERFDSFRLFLARKIVEVPGLYKITATIQPENSSKRSWLDELCLELLDRYKFLQGHLVVLRI